MNITAELAHSSFAQRTAKIRNCMLVEVATGISAIERYLFLSFCQTYEQQRVVTSCLPGESHESFPYCISSTSNSTQRATQSAWPISMLGRSLPLWQQGVGFLVTSRADFGGSHDIDDDPDPDPDPEPR